MDRRGKRRITTGSQSMSDMNITNRPQSTPSTTIEERAPRETPARPTEIPRTRNGAANETRARGETRDTMQQSPQANDQSARRRNPAQPTPPRPGGANTGVNLHSRHH